MEGSEERTHRTQLRGTERDKQRDREKERQTGGGVGGGAVSNLAAEKSRKAERHGSVPLHDFYFFFQQTVCLELMFYITAPGFSAPFFSHSLHFHAPCMLE